MSPSVSFPLGAVASTPSALALLVAYGVPPFKLLGRHQSGDWGSVPPCDALANDEAVAVGGRIHSSYLVGNHEVWIVTAADRSETTLMLSLEC